MHHPTELGGYGITGFIGSGHLWHAYRAIHRASGREVALKLMDHHLAYDLDYREAFRNGIRPVFAIHDPHLVRVRDAGCDGKRIFLAVELLTGGDTGRYLRDHPGALPPRQALGWIRDAARGLDALHQANLVHGEIRPSNLLLTPAGAVKLSEPGIWHTALAALGDRDIVGDIWGTANYTAPAVMGIDEIRADIYALGATLYHLVSGTAPIREGTPIDRSFPDPRLLTPTIPAKLASCIARCTARAPDDRYQTPADLLIDLERMLADPALPTGDWRLPQPLATDPVPSSAAPPIREVAAAALTPPTEMPSALRPPMTLEEARRRLAVDPDATIAACAQAHAWQREGIGTHYDTVTQEAGIRAHLAVLDEAIAVIRASAPAAATPQATMPMDDARRRLAVDGHATLDVCRIAHQHQRRELEDLITGAPTPTLKTTYAQALAQIDQAMASIERSYSPPVPALPAPPQPSLTPLTLPPPPRPAEQTTPAPPRRSLLISIGTVLAKALQLLNIFR